MAKYFIGTSGWHYDDWRGIFYPEKMPKNKWLEYYSGRFRTVELNNTFYRQPSETAVEKWRSNCPADFVFSVKANRFITHIKRLKNCNEALETFISRMSLLKDRLGPFLYQLPPNLKRNDDLLDTFLSALPHGYRHVVEFRHSSWMAEEVFNMLRRYNAGLCVFDLPGFTCPLAATADFAYVRFHGSDSLYSSRYSDNAMSDWAARITEVFADLDTVYIYFNNDMHGFALENAHYLSENLAIY